MGELLLRAKNNDLESLFLHRTIALGHNEVQPES